LKKFLDFFNAALQAAYPALPRLSSWEAHVRLARRQAGSPPAEKELLSNCVAYNRPAGTPAGLFLSVRAGFPPPPFVPYHTVF